VLATACKGHQRSADVRNAIRHTINVANCGRVRNVATGALEAGRSASVQETASWATRVYALNPLETAAELYANRHSGTMFNVLHSRRQHGRPNFLRRLPSPLAREKSWAGRIIRT
jgi:hypothetical protein